MKNSIKTLAIGLIAFFSFFSATLFAQTDEMDKLFADNLAQVKGNSVDTNDILFEVDFPTLEDWERTFAQKWEPVQAQVQANLSSIDKNKPGAEAKIREQKSSSISQYKSLALEVRAVLLKRAEVDYNASLNKLEQMSLSSFQRERELKQLSNSYTQACALIKAKAQEIENRFSSPPVVENQTKKGTVIFDSKKSPETN